MVAKEKAVNVSGIAWTRDGGKKEKETEAVQEIDMGWRRGGRKAGE